MSHPYVPEGTTHAQGKLHKWSANRIRAELSRMESAKEFNSTVAKRYNAARWDIYSKYGGTENITHNSRYAQQPGFHPNLGRRGGNPYRGEGSSGQGFRSRMSSIAPGQKVDDRRYADIYRGGFLEGQGAAITQSSLNAQGRPTRGGYGSGNARANQSGFGSGGYGGRFGSREEAPDNMGIYRTQHDLDIASDRGDTRMERFGGGGMGGSMYPGRGWDAGGQGTREWAEGNQGVWDELDAAKIEYDAGIEEMRNLGSRSGLATTGEGDQFWEQRLRTALSAKRSELMLFNATTNPATAVDPKLIDSRTEDVRRLRNRKAARGGGSPAQGGVLDVTDPSIKEGVV